MTEVIVKKWTEQNLPTTKEGWNEFREQDPIAWGNATQANHDRLFREKRELEEKKLVLENQANNLTVELERYKQQPLKTNEVPFDETQTGSFSINNLPKTQQEWDDLAIDNPTLHTDLRFQYNQNRVKISTNFAEAQANSRRIVQGEHPDMYLAELDESGQPRKDDKGKIVFKRNSSGEPIFNPDSEKGKLWTSIYLANPKIAENPEAPELLMASMERKLRQKGENMVNQSNEERNQRIADGQVVIDGVTPRPKVELVFKSEEEKAYASNMVNRGIYQNLEEYVKNRDNPTKGIYDENRVPDFTRKG